MESQTVVELYQLFDAHAIRTWIDGGWGVDALLGRQTRPHADLDIVVQQGDVPALRTLLDAQDYTDVPRDDTQEWNFVLGDAQGHLLDVHAIVFDDQGNGLYGPPEKGIMYPAASLTGTGGIAGQAVRCIAPEYVVLFHTQYNDPDEDDYRDVMAICRRFGVPVPEMYAHWPGQTHPSQAG